MPRSRLTVTLWFSQRFRWYRAWTSAVFPQTAGNKPVCAIVIDDSNQRRERIAFTSATMRSYLDSIFKKTKKKQHNLHNTIGTYVRGGYVIVNGAKPMCRDTNGILIEINGFSIDNYNIHVFTLYGRFRFPVEPGIVKVYRPCIWSGEGRNDFNRFLRCCPCDDRCAYKNETRRNFRSIG